MLEEALVKRQWLIASDIVRFLRAIHPSDIDSPPRTPLCQRPHQNVSAATRRSALVSSKVTDETDPFVFGNYAAPGIYLILSHFALFFCFCCFQNPINDKRNNGIFILIFILVYIYLFWFGKKSKMFERYLLFIQTFFGSQIENALIT